MSESNYSSMDRLLHRLALNGAIAELSFDIDQRIAQPDTTEVRSQRHVFVSGLARAGTTVLMRRFHATGVYRSLTYRDMPFVLAPNLWRRLSTKSKRDIENAERAHGDDLQVDADSPESLDEVFWRVFAGDEYIGKQSLSPHKPDTDVVDAYVRYVGAILAAQEPPGKRRYLCKNNNNILRLSAIHQALPNALILIPFRDPLQHAYSLLRQHQRFTTLQADDSFALAYMTWLSHHEFGLDHRPVRFGAQTPPAYTTESLNYWLNLWCEVYRWLQQHKPQQARFVCYEDLCTRVETWPRLAALAEIDPAADSATDDFKLSSRPVVERVDTDLAQQAEAIYTGLVSEARNALGRA